jgi:2-polyprenyl-3-methyl-5-hydroxy-6-metoxy-1,4-benzoquinol methylase
MSVAKTMEEVIENQRKIFNQDFEEKPFDGAVQELSYEKRINFSKRYIKKNDVLLSVGCGDGTVVKGLSDSVNRVIALDVSENALRVAKKFNHANNIEYILTPIEKFETTEKFNVIVLFEVIEHVYDPLLVLKKINQLLVPGGVVLISTPNYMRLTRRVKMLPIISSIRKKRGKRNDRINCDHVAEYTFQQVNEFLHIAGFLTIKNEGIIFWTNTIGGNFCRNIKWLQSINFFLGSLFPSIAGHMYVAAKKNACIQE